MLLHAGLAAAYVARMMGGVTGFQMLARMRHGAQDLGRKRVSPRSADLVVAPDSSPLKESFDCLFLCDVCGYLCDTDPVCPSCGQQDWVDLDYWSLAEALRTREEAMRRQPPGSVQWQVRLASLVGGTALGVAGAAGLAFAELMSLGLPSLLGCGALATGLTHLVGRRRFGWSIMTKRVQKPTRWRLPLPLVAPGATIASQASGKLVPRGPLLRAPFSGRPCAGYDIAVMFDTPDDAWPPMWVLREMRSCAFEVGGREVAADSVSLTLPLVPVSGPGISDEAKQRFLRERGLFLVDGSFDLHEAILEPGGSYALLWPSLPENAPPFIRAAAGPGEHGPYR